MRSGGLDHQATAVVAASHVRLDLSGRAGGEGAGDEVHHQLGAQAVQVTPPANLQWPPEGQSCKDVGSRWGRHLCLEYTGSRVALVTSLDSDIFQSFVQSLPSEAEYDPARLEHALRGALGRARESLGELVEALGEPAIAAYLASRLPGYASGEVELERIHAEDLVLAMACTLGRAEAIELFESRYLSLVTVAGRKLGMSDSECDELQQLVRTRLLVGEPPRIASFAGTGTLRSWVYATAMRVGLNELRRIGRAPVPAGDEQLLVALPDPEDDQELRYMKELYRAAFRDSFKKAIATLEDRLANVLRHYYLDEIDSRGDWQSVSGPQDHHDALAQQGPPPATSGDAQADDGKPRIAASGARERHPSDRERHPGRADLGPALALAKSGGNRHPM